MTTPNTPNDICGCLFTLPSGREVSLPLHSVSVNVHIADVLALVTLTQFFANPNSTRVPAQARYVFPVPVGGAVCGFEMHTSGGKTIVGEVKEAIQAEREFKEAIAKNKTAGLLAKAAPDVFTMSLGAIPPKDAIKTIVTYVIELADDEVSNQVRFSLPTYVGLRYGRPPTAPLTQGARVKYAQFTLLAEIQMPFPIEQVRSPSHSIKIFIPSGGDSASRCSAVLDASAGAVLDKDFILSIKAGRLDTPRCVAAISPKQGSVALSLTLVPRFGLQPVASQEYVFLIDRSASMRGESKIDYAKKALLIMLKSLPTSGTVFNIYSFGSSHSSLWPASVPYSQATLAAAVLHVDSMDADMGGTEIASALHSVLESRTSTVPTSVFVLTDGEVWQMDLMLADLSARVAAAGDSASGTYLRVFTLGVGHAASSALCGGLARAGNGLCLMTTQSEELAGKCARLLRASRVPPSGNLRNVRVDWGYAGPDGANRDGEGPSAQITEPVPPAAATTFFDEAHDPLVPSTDTGFPGGPSHLHPGLLQAPSVVPDFYPGSRLIVSAILHRTQRVPEHVVLRGETPDGAPVELRVPVRPIDLPEARAPLLHTLAARKIVQELEDGYVQRLGLQSGVGAADTEGIARGAAVFYSVQYQLASKYASFVAVDKGVGSAEPGDSSDFELVNESDVDAEWVDDLDREGDPKENGHDVKESGPDTGSSPRSYVPTHTGYSRAEHEVEQSFAAPQGTSSQKRIARSRVICCSNPPDAVWDLESDDDEPRSRGVTPRSVVKPLPIPPPPSMPISLRLNNSPPRARAAASRVVPEDDAVTAIARLQSFDGSFELEDALCKLVFGDRLTLNDLRDGIPVFLRPRLEAERLWAAAIAVAYLKTTFGDVADVWVGLWEKANGYATGVLVGSPESFDQLVTEAAQLVL